MRGWGQFGKRKIFGRECKLFWLNCHKISGLPFNTCLYQKIFIVSTVTFVYKLADIFIEI